MKAKTEILRKNILMAVANTYPEGIEESELLSAVAEKAKISDIESLKEHLNGLEGYLVKHTAMKGKLTIWSCSPNRKVFDKVLWEFLVSDFEERRAFINTKYVQEMINEESIKIYLFDWFVKLQESPELKKLITEFEKPPSIMSTIKNFIDPDKAVEYVKKNQEAWIKMSVEVFRSSPFLLRVLAFPEDTLKEFLVFEKFSGYIPSNERILECVNTVLRHLKLVG